jgi:hypothetical protein
LNGARAFQASGSGSAESLALLRSDGAYGRTLQAQTRRLSAGIAGRLAAAQSAVATRSALCLGGRIPTGAPPRNIDSNADTVEELRGTNDQDPVAPSFVHVARFVTS